MRLFHVLFCADRLCGAERSGEADRVGELDEGSVAMYTAAQAKREGLTMYDC